MKRHAAALGLLAAVAPEQAQAQAQRSWMVIHTWPWTQCADASAAVLAQGGTAMAAVVAGLSVAEEDLSIDSVGYGNHPDASGEPTLDAAVMCGATARIGAVGQLRGVKQAAATARLVLEHTRHTLLVGDAAADFATSFGGLPRVSLSTNSSDLMWQAWRDGGCQPNYFSSVVDTTGSGCGPFLPAESGMNTHATPAQVLLSEDMHDTISMAVLDGMGHIASGTSTNGLSFKIPGRVGDAAIPGSGNYARNGIGGCGATGDGDVLMRFLPCYQALESLRLGWSPLDAAEDALRRIAEVDADFQGALFVVTADGKHAGAVHNWEFQYTVRTADGPAVVYTVHPRPDYVPRGPALRQSHATDAMRMLLSALLGCLVTAAAVALFNNDSTSSASSAAGTEHTYAPPAVEAS